MKISNQNLEFLVELINKRAIPETYRASVILLGPEPANNDLRSLGLARLETIEGFVKTYRTEKTGLRHPDRRLKANSVLDKIGQTIAGFRNPKLDPDRSVKVFRMMQKLNNANEGLQTAKFSRKTYVNSKRGLVIGTPLPNFKFNESNGGDVHIMGQWHDVMEMLSRSSGASFTSEVPDGDGVMPLFVSLTFGYVVAETVDERVVVLDPGKELAKAAANLLLPFMPPVPAPLANPFSEARSAVQSEGRQQLDRHFSQEVQAGASTASDVKDEGDKLQKAIDQLRTPGTDRTKISITVGLQPLDINSAHQVFEDGSLTGHKLNNMLYQLRARGLAGS